MGKTGVNLVIKTKGTCPYCGGSHEIIGVRTFDGAKELARWQFLSGLYQIKICTHCFKMYTLPMAVLYHNSEKDYAVWWCPENDRPFFHLIKQDVAMIDRLQKYIDTAPVYLHWEQFKMKIIRMEEGIEI